MKSIKRFFSGRYGLDYLTFFLLILALGIPNIRNPWILSALLILYCLTRILSRNIPARQREL
ncbi:MAG TPA: hypothetical protein DD727_01745, partial [Clostridiales bacterium]|nr:hypothetical protein [Clostridiales bacterium]